MPLSSPAGPPEHLGRVVLIRRYKTAAQNNCNHLRPSLSLLRIQHPLPPLDRLSLGVFQKPAIIDGDDLGPSRHVQAAGNALGAVSIVAALGLAEAAAAFGVVVGSLLMTLLDPHGRPRGVQYDGVRPAAAAAAAVVVLERPFVDDELSFVDD